MGGSAPSPWKFCLSRNDVSLRDHFERCWPWLAAALARFDGTHTKEDLWQSIADGTAHLWPLERSAMVTTIETYPTGLKQIHGWLAGGDLKEIVDYVPTIEKWAKECCGCSEVVIVGRKGWLKAFEGYKDAGTIMRKAI